jgi:hypothetical protein
VAAPERAGQPGVVEGLFPFTAFFADAPQPLFRPGASYADDMEVCACVCMCVCARECRCAWRG